MTKININGRSIGPHAPPYIIAEVSANHNGSMERALETVRSASENGADAVKIQTYTADSMTIDCQKPDFLIKGGLWDGRHLYELYQEACTPYEWHRPIFDLANDLGIALFSTPFDEPAVDLLEELNAPAYKIASFENIDYPLIEYTAQTGKPMIISTGMASYEDIEGALEAAEKGGCKDVILLHCVSSYPAEISDANLLKINRWRDKFDKLVGLSDHTLGVQASVLASALGACVIEKHFTLSRADKGPDSEFSLEPDELKLLSSETKLAFSALGDGSEERGQGEAQNMQFRRSIYFVKDLPEGHKIKETDIRRIRPGHGLAPKYFNDIVGRVLSKEVERGEPTCWECFQNG